MPDLAMCNGDGCPLKADCYRHRAVPSQPHQNYFMPLRPDGSCTHFIKLRRTDVLSERHPGSRSCL